MISTTPIALGQARWVVVAGLVGFAAGSWLYLGVVAARMGDMSSVLAMPMTSAWSPIQAALMVTMWAVMRGRGATSGAAYRRAKAQGQAGGSAAVGDGSG